MIQGLLGYVLALVAPAIAAGQPKDVAIGGNYGCALYESGDVWCWGGMLDDKPELPLKARRIKGLPPAIAIDVSHLGACIATRSLEAWCWGVDYQQSLRLEKFVKRGEPFRIEGLPPVSLVQIGLDHYCAIARYGQIWCWGGNTCGELGCGDRHSRERPQQVSALPPALALSAGVSNTCAVLVGGEIACWGTDNPSKTGNEPFAFTSDTPALLDSELVGRFRDVSNGRNFACGIRESGEVTCWGSNLLGQLGSQTPRLQVSALGFVAEVDGVTHAQDLATSWFTGCAVTEGKVVCWGAKLYDMGENVVVAAPTPVPGIAAARRVAIGDQFTCAIDGGKVVCWGESAIDGVPILPGMAPETPVPVPGLPAG